MFDDRIARAFGIQPAGVIALEGRMFMSNYRVRDQGGKWFFIKCCPSQQEVSHLNLQQKMHRHLRSELLPIPEMIPTQDGKSGFAYKGRLFTCFQFIPHDEKANPNVKGAGEMLARLHLSMKRCDINGTPWLASLQDIHQIKERLLPWLEELPLKAKTELDHQICREIPLIQKSFMEAEHLAEFLKSGSQWIHGDFNPNNVLTSCGKIVACIDFGDMSWGHPLEDVADAALMYFSVGQTNGTIRVNPEQCVQFLQGYVSVNQLHTAGVELLPIILQARCVRRLAYFAENYRFYSRMKDVQRILKGLLFFLRFYEDHPKVMDKLKKRMNKEEYLCWKK
ncbi:phosphotransferase enzyme family protein [Paenactinomyces guangxiensis]|uniref:Phosphotransferase n=1 Tax=Paenactinomyces guangxiensis TaxID=1490290 RepID=A0A7W1WN55_9BACL|nr:phosphotransferase [Paenactinomyces guangxiensis]MBA4492987.1 phosphotransferase [Paenactinomyces guangxiensis]MBH8590164.1 phosphotransferase [Paenactinomyces guangxiensis]